MIDEITVTPLDDMTCEYVPIGGDCREVPTVQVEAGRECFTFCLEHALQYIRNLLGGNDPAQGGARND